jgi:hypothetical protein
LLWLGSSASLCGGSIQATLIELRLADFVAQR